MLDRVEYKKSMLEKLIWIWCAASLVVQSSAGLFHTDLSLFRTDHCGIGHPLAAFACSSLQLLTSPAGSFRVQCPDGGGRKARRQCR